MERPSAAFPSALNTDVTNNAELAVHQPSFVCTGHQPSWTGSSSYPVEQKIAMAAAEPTPPEQLTYRTWIMPREALEPLSHPMPNSAVAQYFASQDPANAPPILEPNVAADKHRARQPTEAEMGTWYFSHPVSDSSCVDVPDFRNYGHGPYHGRVGPYPYATHAHAPAPPKQPTKPEYDQILNEAMPSGESSEMTAREQYMRGMNAVTALRNKRLLEEYRDLPHYTHVHPHPRPRTLQNPGRTRFTEALMSLREEQAEDRCIAIDHERDMIQRLVEPFQAELQGYRKAKGLVN